MSKTTEDVFVVLDKAFKRNEAMMISVKKTTVYFWDTNNPLVKICFSVPVNSKSSTALMSINIGVATSERPDHFMRLADRTIGLEAHEKTLQILFPVSSANFSKFLDDDLVAFACELADASASF